MWAENADREFVFIDVEYIILLNSLIVLGLLVLYLVVTPAALYVPVGHDLHWGYPILQHVITHFEIADEIFVAGADSVNLAVVVDERARQAKFALEREVLGVETVTSLNGSYSPVCVQDKKGSNRTVLLDSQ